MPACFWCKEEVLPGEESPLPLNGRRGEAHRECMVRSIAGSVGHQAGRCSCFGGEEEDPPGMTVREAARAAYQMFMDGMLSETKGKSTFR